jgi:MOSC domain-containing protein YiiM
MMEVSFNTVTVAEGLIGDCRGTGGPFGRRQITLLSREQWAQACGQLGTELDWLLRRANLYVADAIFGYRLLQRKLAIGYDVAVEITGETAPCKRMDEQFPGLKAALEPDWRGGVTCKVIHGGTIRYGDTVALL